VLNEAAMQSHNEQRRESNTKHPGKPSPPGNKQGLVLDDFLWATYDMRRHFDLRTPQFGLKQIEQYPGARETVGRLIQATIDRHGGEIYSKPGRLLSEISTDIYSERVATPAYSGRKISPKWIGQSLRKLLEEALQTLAQLPDRDSKPDYSPRKLRLLASHFSKLAEEADAVLQQKEARDRFLAYFRGNGEAGRDRLLRIAEEMRWAAATLSVMISRTRVVKSHISSPNPQVRFALYMAGWFKASTRREQYAPLATLITAAFCVAGKETPKWVDRLAVEMHLQRRRRKSHFLSSRLYSQTSNSAPV